ncbi:MAG TPA: hypothetical protein PLJ48_07995 [Dermatophilaceae bacterium]|nr:hypothetical protein [Dermatophilaceae bacterium]
MRDIGVGVISLGWMGRLHSTSYLAAPLRYSDLGVRTRLVHAADPVPEAREYAAEQLGFARASADYRLQVAGNLLQRFWLETRAVDPLPAQATRVWPIRSMDSASVDTPP